MHSRRSMKAVGKCGGKRLGPYRGPRLLNWSGGEQLCFSEPDAGTNVKCGVSSEVSALSLLKEAKLEFVANKVH